MEMIIKEMQSILRGLNIRLQQAIEDENLREMLLVLDLINENCLRLKTFIETTKNRIA